MIRPFYSNLFPCLFITFLPYFRLFFCEKTEKEPESLRYWYRRKIRSINITNMRCWRISHYFRSNKHGCSVKVPLALYGRFKTPLNGLIPVWDRSNIKHPVLYLITRSAKHRIWTRKHINSKLEILPCVFFFSSPVRFLRGTSCYSLVTNLMVKLKKSVILVSYYYLKEQYHEYSKSRRKM